MGFLGLDFDNVFEPKSMKEGDYQLRVISAELKQQKPEKGTGQFIQLRLEIMNEPEAKDILQVLMLPAEGDDVKKRNKRLSAIQTLIRACGQEPSAISNVEQLQGCTLWATLVEESDPEYGTQNRVRRFSVPK